MKYFYDYRKFFVFIFSSKKYGRRHLKDILHESNEIFANKGSFAKREKSEDNLTQGIDKNYFHHRFPKSHEYKIPVAFNDECTRSNLNAYLSQKKKILSANSLNFESELFQKYDLTAKLSDLVTKEPYRHYTGNSPWKYSNTKNNYQKCTNRFRKVRNTCIDLSKY